MSWPWETRTSTCRNFATISSGLYRFLAIAVLLDVETYLKSDHFVGGGSLGPRGGGTLSPISVGSRVILNKTQCGIRYGECNDQHVIRLYEKPCLLDELF